MKVRTADKVFLMRAAGEVLLVSEGSEPVHPSRAVVILGSPGFVSELDTGLDTEGLTPDELETVKSLLELGYLVKI
ncbi:MAG: hypothetical protein J5830_05115 [Clostridia bacterium]|nr:hypothetical protein [Clostridia bacterium]